MGRRELDAGMVLRVSNGLRNLRESKRSKQNDIWRDHKIISRIETGVGLPSFELLEAYVNKFGYEAVCEAVGWKPRNYYHFIFADPVNGVFSVKAHNLDEANNNCIKWFGRTYKHEDFILDNEAGREVLNNWIDVENQF